MHFDMTRKNRTFMTVLRSHPTRLRHTIHKGLRTFTALCLALSFSMASVADPAPAFAAATTYYVAKTGSDTAGDGSSARPWATIQKAANTISGGDTVLVGPGTYNERVTIASTKSGTAGATTKLIASGAVVIAQGLSVKSSYTELSGFEVTPGSSAISDAWSVGQVDITGNHNTLTGFFIHDLARASALVFTDNSTASYNTVADLTISHVPHNGVTFGRGTSHNTISGGTISDFGGNTGIDVENYPQGSFASYATIEDVTVTGPSGWNQAAYGGWAEGDGIRANGPFTTVRRCVIDVWQERHPSSAGSPHTDNMQFWVDYDGLLIEDSIIGSYNTTHSYDGKHAGSSCINHGGYSNTTDQNWTMRNCLLLVPDAGPSSTDNPSDNPVSYSGGSYSRAQIYNNVFWGKRSSFNTAKLKARNNVFMKTTNTPQAPGYTLGTDSDYNLFVGSGRPAGEGAHSLLVASNAAVGFVNPDTSVATNYGIDADWHLAAASPAIDKGIAEAATPTTDKDGAARDTTPDIGAYEFSASGTSISASAPQVASYGARATLAGTLADVSGAGLSAREVGLQLLRGTDWVEVSKAQTGTSGAFSVQSPQLVTASVMRVSFNGDGSYRATRSPSVRVTPKPYLTPPKTASIMRRGRAYTAYGYLKPRHVAGTKPVRVFAYRYQRGRWVLRTSWPATAYDYSSYSRYRARIRPPYRGRWRLRVGHPADGSHAAAFSGWRYVVVR